MPSRPLTTTSPEIPRSGPVGGGGGGGDTVTDTALEQLFVVSDSPVTASTHAP